MAVHKRSETEKEQAESRVYHLVARGIEPKVAAPYFNSLHTLFSCINKIEESCSCVGLSGCSSP